MTVEALTPAPPYVIAGTGPYPVPHPYAGASDLVLTVAIDADVSVTLTPGEHYSVAPAASTTTGAITLTSGAAATHAGRTLTITRVTRVEQGWAAVSGPREVGLERQLDRLAMALQDRDAAAWAEAAAAVASDGRDLLINDFGASPALADNSAAIIAAFTAAGATGRQVSALPGTYMVASEIAWPITVGFCARFPVGVVFKATATHPASAKMFIPGNPAAAARFEWRGGRIDGSLKPTGVSAPSLMSINRKNLKGVLFEGTDFYLNADRAGTAGDDILFLGEAEDITVRNCRFWGARDAAIYISGDPTEAFGRRVEITGNRIYHSIVGIISKRQFLHHVIAQNHIEDCVNGVTIGGEADGTLLPGRHATISDNVLVRCWRAIEARRSDGTVIAGNVVVDPGAPWAPTYTADISRAIVVAGSDGCIVANNSIFCLDHTPVAGAVGIQIQPSTGIATVYAFDNLVIGNVVTGLPTGFAEVNANNNRNAFVANRAVSCTTDFVLAGAASTIAGPNGAGAHLLSLGRSGATPIAGADTITEHGGPLIEAKLVPAGESWQVIIAVGAESDAARLIFDPVAGRWSVRIGAAIGMLVDAKGPVPPRNTLAGAAAGSTRGTLHHIDNGRKPGEGVGAGTGVLAYWSEAQAAWISVHSGVAVTV